MMKLGSISKSKKIAISVSAACIMLAATAGSVIWLYTKNTPPPTVSCLQYSTGIYVWPDTMQAFADESYGVVLGAILDGQVHSMSDADNSPHTHLHVTEVIKGRALHKGDTLELCPTGPVDFNSDNHTVLVFLAGKDHNAWLPNRSGEGIIPQSKDGRFRQEWGDGSKTSATTADLKKLIKN